MTDDFPPSRVAGAPDDGTDQFDRLLIRYFLGQSSREDQCRLERWIVEKPGRTQELERLRYLWQRSAAEPMDVDVEAPLARFKNRVHRSQEGATPALKARRMLVASGQRMPWLAMAAGLVLAVGTGLWWHQRPSTTGVAERAAAPRMYATARAQRFTVHLADGTSVMLAPGSMLEVPADFGASNRDVQLVGLAFFSVAKDSSRPFRVRGGGGIVQVLGTKFAARADRGNETTIEVVVSEGRVALRPWGTLDRGAAGDSVLTHGDLGYLAPDGTVKVVHGVDLAKRLAWIEGRLSFDQTPLPVVLRELETWFNVDFVLASPALRHAQLTTTIDHDSLADMLRVLETALGVRADVRDKTITLSLPSRSS